MKLKEIILKIEQLAPPELAEFDYVGLVTGDLEKDIKKICISLDLVTSADEAIKQKCDLLITHHNFGIGKGKRPSNRIEQKALNKLTKANIAYYAAHLHLDFAINGLIHNLCKILGFKGEPIKAIYEGIEIKGGVYLIKEPATFDNIISRLKKLSLTSLRIAGTPKDKYNRIIITTGAGFFPEFMEQLRPDAYIAGELTHTAICAAEILGITLFEMNHSAEKLPLKMFSKYLQEQINVPVEFIESSETLKVINLGGKNDAIGSSI